MNDEEIKPDEALESVEEIPAGELTEVFKDSLLDEAPLSDPISADEFSELDQQPDPNENSNPIIAVEEMLDAAVLNEPSTTNMTALASNQPTFQIHLSLKPEQKEAFKKIAAQFSLDANAQIISHLTEYLVICVAKELRECNILFRTHLVLPESNNSEEDMALGSLLTVPDPNLTQTESAPQVLLPKNESGVLLFTGNEIPGCLLIQTLGLVSAHRSLARRFFRDEELQEQMNREISKIGGQSIPKSKVESLFRDLFFDLQKNALSQGGNAVLGTRIEAFPETNHLDPGLEQMRLVAIGTAAVVEKV